jgi:hypothetical protein
MKKVNQKTNTASAAKEDNRQNEIIRIQKKRNNFVMLDKGYIEDARLSNKAKGILTYLLSKPDGWKVIVKDIVNHSADGKKSIYSGLRELKKYGYYKKEPVRDETNRVISHWESVVYECPIEPEIAQKEEKTTKSEKKSEKSTISPLLTPFVEIQNVEIQNVDIQNGQRNNIESYQNVTNQKVISINRESEDKAETPDNDMIDTKERKKFDEGIRTPLNKDDTIPQSKPNIDAPVNNIIKTFTRQEVADKLSLDEIKKTHSDKQEEIEMLFDAVCEVLTVENPISPTFRISRQNLPFIQVKDAFMNLEQSHISYVIDSLNKNDNKYKIKGNVKSYLMTALFHSLRTISYYHNRTFTKKEEPKSFYDEQFEKAVKKSMERRERENETFHNDNSFE